MPKMSSTGSEVGPHQSFDFMNRSVAIDVENFVSSCAVEISHKILLMQIVELHLIIEGGISVLGAGEGW